MEPLFSSEIPNFALFYLVYYFGAINMTNHTFFTSFPKSYTRNILCLCNPTRAPSLAQSSLFPMSESVSFCFLATKNALSAPAPVLFPWAIWFQVPAVASALDLYTQLLYPRRTAGYETILSVRRPAFEVKH